MPVRHSFFAAGHVGSILSHVGPFSPYVGTMLDHVGAVLGRLRSCWRTAFYGRHMYKTPSLRMVVLAIRLFSRTVVRLRGSIVCAPLFISHVGYYLAIWGLNSLTSFLGRIHDSCAA